MTESRAMPLLLDTDIGGDIDDILALSLALSSRELQLVGVTTVNTEPPMRARVAAKILHAFGHDDIPVSPGEKEMLTKRP